MTENKGEDIEKIVLSRLVRMNAIMAGITTGTVVGLAIFLSTIYLIIKGGPVVGPHLALLGQFFPGYTVTLLGSLIGLVYGFACGFAAGYVCARIYNWLVDSREAKQSRKS